MVPRNWPFMILQVGAIVAARGSAAHPGDPVRRPDGARVSGRLVRATDLRPHAQARIVGQVMAVFAVVIMPRFLFGLADGRTFARDAVGHAVAALLGVGIVATST